MLAVLNDTARGSVSDHAEAAHARRPLDVVPFEPWHLEWLTEMTAEAWLGKDLNYGRMLKSAGPCFTGFVGDQVIACAGAFQVWEGRAQAWSMLSTALPQHIMGVHRAVKRFLDRYPVRRVEITVDPRSAPAVKWAQRLGFSYEGTMPGYTPQGDTMDLYARVHWR